MMECAYEWEFKTALESIIQLLIKAHEKGWGKWELGIHEKEPKYMKLEIEGRTGDKHFFKIDIDGKIVPQPVNLNCF